MITKQDLLDLGFMEGHVGQAHDNTLEAEVSYIFMEHKTELWGVIKFYDKLSSIGKYSSLVADEDNCGIRYIPKRNLSVEQLSSFDYIFIETPKELKEFLNKYFFKTPL